MIKGGAIPENSTQFTRGPLLAVTAMLILVPVVSVQGPWHTTPFDAFNFLFMTLYWLSPASRRHPLSFPMLTAIWLILLGSCLGMYHALEPGRALLVLVKEIYLYIWFITAVHFLTHRCRAVTIASIWVSVAGILGFLMAVDANTGLFGGHIGGEIRGAGTFENPNMCGSYLVMSLFLAWSVGSGGQRKFYLAVPVLFVAILATASNGAMLSLAVGSSVAFAINAGRRSLFSAVGAGLITAAIGIAVVGVAHERLANSALDLMSRGRGSVGGTAIEGASERFPLWLDVADSVQRVPTGVGPGNFNRQGGRVSGDIHGAHNEYLGMLAERGPVGLAGWCGVLLGAAAMLSRLRTRAAAAGSLGLGVEVLIGALAAFSLHSMVMEFFHFRHLWMFLVLIYTAGAQMSAEPFRGSVLARPAQPAMVGGV